jgi:hypothetical protein
VSYSTISRTVPFSGDNGEQYGGGMVIFPAAVGSVTESTLADNTNFGVFDEQGTATVDNSTVTGTATSAGSTLSGGLIVGAAPPDIERPAAYRQHSAGRSGSAAIPADAVAGLTAAGTIVAQNSVPDCSGTVTDGGYNLDSDGTCGLTATGSKAHAAAVLGALADNGGPTLTVPPGTASAARNAIPVGSAGCVTNGVDQRGKPRSNPANGKCDIGAVEAAVVNPKITLKATAPHLHSGWYRGTVTVHSTCTVGSAALTAKCPADVHLHSSGSHTVSKTIHALDGGVASASKKLKIDNTKPTIRIKLVPVTHHNEVVLKLRGTCSDPLSGVASCTIHTHRAHGIVHYTVAARDVAGNKRSKSGKYDPK